MQKRKVFGIVIPSVMILLYLSGNYWLKAMHIQLLSNEALNHMLLFQLYGLTLSIITIIITVNLHRSSASFLRFGNLKALAVPVKILGIRKGDNWYKTGASYLIAITTITTAYMYAGVGDKLNWSLLADVMPLVLLFSIINSFNEEMITRFAVVGMLDGVMPATRIMCIAAAIFGLIHYFGVPGGTVGVIMAGFLGWVLAKSVIEIRGIGIAWVVHFVQDVVIFSMLLIMR